jgi:hypothetical protein
MDFPTDEDAIALAIGDVAMTSRGSTTFFGISRPP